MSKFLFTVFLCIPIFSQTATEKIAKLEKLLEELQHQTVTLEKEYQQKIVALEREKTLVENEYNKNLQHLLNLIQNQNNLILSLQQELQKLQSAITEQQKEEYKVPFDREIWENCWNGVFFDFTLDS